MPAKKRHVQNTCNAWCNFKFVIFYNRSSGAGGVVQCSLSLSLSLLFASEDKKPKCLCRMMTRLEKSEKVTSVSADKRIPIQMMSVLCSRHVFENVWPTQNTRLSRLRLASSDSSHWTIFVSCFFATKIQEAVFVTECFDAFPRSQYAREAGMTRAFVVGQSKTFKSRVPSR